MLGCPSPCVHYIFSCDLVPFTCPSPSSQFVVPSCSARVDLPLLAWRASPSCPVFGLASVLSLTMQCQRALHSSCALVPVYLSKLVIVPVCRPHDAVPPSSTLPQQSKPSLHAMSTPAVPLLAWSGSPSCPVLGFPISSSSLTIVASRSSPPSLTMHGAQAPSSGAPKSVAPQLVCRLKPRRHGTQARRPRLCVLKSIISPPVLFVTPPKKTVMLYIFAPETPSVKKSSGGWLVTLPAFCNKCHCHCHK